jgi:hypothetical protein
VNFNFNKNSLINYIKIIEIVEGNLKSIMKLILAIAAHFKSSNIKPTITHNHNNNNNNRKTTTKTSFNNSIQMNSKNGKNNNIYIHESLEKFSIFVYIFILTKYTY